METSVTPANLLNRLIENGLLPNYDPVDLLLAIESISPEALDLLRSIAINRKYHSNPWYSHAQTDHSIDNLEDSANYVLFNELLNKRLILSSVSSPGYYLFPCDYNLILDAITLLSTL